MHYLLILPLQPLAPPKNVYFDVAMPEFSLIQTEMEELKSNLKCDSDFLNKFC